MHWLIEHAWLLFLALLVSLLLVVEAGIRVRHTLTLDEERQSLIESARNGLNVVLNFLLGFSLPIALSHFEQRTQLVVDEANAIPTANQRAQMLPESLRAKILQLVRVYLDARIQFGKDSEDAELQASIAHAKRVPNEMWQQSVTLACRGFVERSACA